MTEGSHLLYGALEPRGTPMLTTRSAMSDPTWPSPYWFEEYRGFADQPHLLSSYSGTESWIMRYHRLPSDVLSVIDGRGECLERPDEHLLRFQNSPRELVRVSLIHEDGHVELEDCTQIWVAPSASWESLDCARRAWLEFEPEQSGPWRNQDAKWHYCPDQELLYWADGEGAHRVGLRASTSPIAS